MVYKFDLSVYETQLNNLNTLWIEQYRANNPNDTVTQRYTEGTIFMGFGYIIKDAVTEQYITDYLEIVENVPQWHEDDKAIQIVQNKSGVVWGAMNEPQIAMGLSLHRINTNMATYEEGEKLYFYANTILPEHQAIFNAYPQLEISINEK
jgi:hypothetical protein